MAAISGTNGPDNLQGTPEDDVIEGLGGDDRILGGDGRDELYGGDGSDFIHSSSQQLAARLSGGTGEDLLYVETQYFSSEDLDNPPVMLADGGSGIDTARLNANFGVKIDISDPSIPQTIRFLLNDNSDRVYFEIVLSNTEVLEFSGGGHRGADITGGAYNDVLSGSSGISDILRGGGGDDNLSGGDGPDTLLGGDGDDTLHLITSFIHDYLIDGGEGTDTLNFSGIFSYRGPNGINFSVADPSLEQTLFGSPIRSVERLDGFGTEYDDSVTGGSFDDQFDGFSGSDIFYAGDGDDVGRASDGNDRYYGQGGSDRFSGELGDDILEGGAGADWLSGGEGEDTLNGGEGADQLFGGIGADVFVFATTDLGFNYGLRDQIYDFEVGVDLLDLSAFTGAVITIVHGGNDRVKIDFDGDLKTDALIQVETVGGAHLTMEDLIL